MDKDDLKNMRFKTIAELESSEHFLKKDSNNDLQFTIPGNIAICEPMLRFFNGDPINLNLVKESLMVECFYYDEWQIHSSWITPIYVFKVGDMVKIPTKKTTSGLKMSDHVMIQWLKAVNETGNGYVEITAINSEGHFRLTSYKSIMPNFNACDLELYNPEQEKKELLADSLYEFKVGDYVQYNGEDAKYSGKFGYIRLITNHKRFAQINIEHSDNIVVFDVKNLTLVISMLQALPEKTRELCLEDNVKIVSGLWSNYSGYIKQISANYKQEVRIEVCLLIPNSGDKLVVCTPNELEYQNSKYKFCLNRLDHINNNSKSIKLSKTNQNGCNVKQTEQQFNEHKNSKDSLLSGTNRSQISERRTERGVGLKSNSIKGRLGGDNCHYQERFGRS